MENETTTQAVNTVTDYTNEVKMNNVQGGEVNDMIEQMNKMQENMGELDQKVAN